MPTAAAIHVVPVDDTLRPALLHQRVLPAPWDDVGAIDNLPAGFHNSGGLYHGGRSGPQRLLLRPLP